MIKIYAHIIFFNAELIKNKIFFKKIQRVNITLKLKMSIITYLLNTLDILKSKYFFLFLFIKILLWITLTYYLSILLYFYLNLEGILI